MTHAMTSSTPIRRIRPASRFIVGTMAIVGGAMVAIGVALPWFSLFAGLQPVSAIGTSNGTLLLIGAVIAAGLGILAIVRDSAFVRRALLVAGVVLVAFGAYLVVGLVTVYRTVSADPMLVAQPGPGLAIVGVGALLVLATALVRD
jgi:hypothetical protein